MKRVLITGAAGFLGSHLCDRFIREGCEVVGMDNLITGDLKNIEHLLKLKEFSQSLIPGQTGSRNTNNPYQDNPENYLTADQAIRTDVFTETSPLRDHQRHPKRHRRISR